MTERKEKAGNIKANAPAIPLHQEKHLIKEFVHTHHALISVFSREIGISPVKLQLLHEFLHAGQDGLGVINLASRLGVTPALVTRQVQELEQKGWLKRRGDSSDGRRSIVYLTEKGENEVTKIHERAHLFEKTLTSDIPDSDIAAVISTLKILRNKLRLSQVTGVKLINGKVVDNIE